MPRFCLVLLVCLSAFTAPARIVAAERSVEVRASFQNVRLIGFTRPRATIELISEEPGRFESVVVDVGDEIGEAGLFGCLDSTYVDLKLAANEAQQARLRADLEYFRKQADRFSDLVSRNTTAMSELDNVNRQKLGTEAQLLETEVLYRELEERKRRHCIGASEGWRVIERLVDPGQWVNTGDAVGSIADFSVLLTPFALSYQQYQVLKAGPQEITVRLLDEGMQVKAQAVHINPDFNEVTRKISVDLAIEKGPREMRGGLRVQLQLRVPDPSGAVLVPMAALEERYEQYWVRRDDGQELPVVYLGRIDVGQEKWARVVSTDLGTGDRVMVSD